MQHGAWPVYPVGQVVLPPPKQRGMPDESSLQTSFLPSQQSCEALIFPPSGSTGAPQMLPTGLQAWPLSQRPVLHTTLPLGLVPPPQQAWSLMQLSPVRRQPVAGMHTVAPEPGSKQMREQQVLPPVQGLPPWVHPPAPPPDTLRHRPVPPSPFAEHALPQHWAFAVQTSPLAWHEYAATQRPPWQFVEQQSVPTVQVSPWTRQLPPASAWHCPAGHDLVQQALGSRVEQVPPVAVQKVLAQVPPVQRLEQHSELALQLCPAFLQKSDG